MSALIETNSFHPGINEGRSPYCPLLLVPEFAKDVPGFGLVIGTVLNGGASHNLTMPFAASLTSKFPSLATARKPPGPCPWRSVSATLRVWRFQNLISPSLLSVTRLRLSGVNEADQVLELGLNVLTSRGFSGSAMSNRVTLDMPLEKEASQRSSRENSTPTPVQRSS